MIRKIEAVTERRITIAMVDFPSWLVDANVMPEYCGYDPAHRSEKLVRGLHCQLRTLLIPLSCVATACFSEHPDTLETSFWPVSRLRDLLFSVTLEFEMFALISCRNQIKRYELNYIPCLLFFII